MRRFIPALLLAILTISAGTVATLSPRSSTPSSLHQSMPTSFHQSIPSLKVLKTWTSSATKPLRYSFYLGGGVCKPFEIKDRGWWIRVFGRNDVAKHDAVLIALYQLDSLGKWSFATRAKISHLCLGAIANKWGLLDDANGSYNVSQLPSLGLKNELRGWKFWSPDQTPNYYVVEYLFGYQNTIEEYDWIGQAPLTRATQVISQLWRARLKSIS
jgi:hypothetical protein